MPSPSRGRGTRPGDARLRGRSTAIIPDSSPELRTGGSASCPYLEKDGEGRGEARRLVVYESRGRTGGLRGLQDEGRLEHSRPGLRLTVEEAVGCTPRGTREIWRYLLEVDLMRTLKTWRLPPDHPLICPGLGTTPARHDHGRWAVDPDRGRRRRSRGPDVRERRERPWQSHPGPARRLLPVECGPLAARRLGGAGGASPEPRKPRISPWTRTIWARCSWGVSQPALSRLRDVSWSYDPAPWPWPTAYSLRPPSPGARRSS